MKNNFSKAAFYGNILSSLFGDFIILLRLKKDHFISEKVG